ncbi:MAG: cytochrome c3 family protein [Gammaproteobacteria bacterium]|nr:cytochrome c3 family protein [Gammaproteobacteria bacterium]
MRCRIIQLSRAGSATRLAREVSIEAHSLRIGRGTGNEIFLPDPRVALHAASIFTDDDGLRLVATGSQAIELNGTPVPGARLRIDDSVRIGPYEIRIVDPGEEHDLACSVELVQTLPQSPVQMPPALGQGRNPLLRKRVLGTVLALTVLVVFGLLPLIGDLVQGESTRPALLTARSPASSWATWRELWSAGHSANAHGFFAEQCRVCHTAPFQPVASARCLDCHRDLARHGLSSTAPTPAGGPHAGAAGECRDCHEEHSGARQLTRNSDAFCIACHADPRAHKPGSLLLAVSGFEQGHPPFRLAGYRLLAEGPIQTWGKRALAPAIDRSNLNYAHKAHGGAVDGVRHPTLGRWKFGCADCHDREPDGTGFRPVRYQAHCADCHRLALDIDDERTRLPHDRATLFTQSTANMLTAALVAGDWPARLQRAAARAGEDAAARGEHLATWFADLDATVHPDEPLGDDALARIQARVQDPAFGEQACGLCHEISAPDGATHSATAGATGSSAGWSTAPLRVAEQWFAFARFDHRRHQQIGCNDCHKATASASARDVIIPDIELCKGCHVGQDAADGRLRAEVRIRCVDCHQFHHLGPPYRRAER